MISIELSFSFLTGWDMITGGALGANKYITFVWHKIQYCSKVTPHSLALPKLPLICSILFALCTSLVFFHLSFIEHSTKYYNVIQTLKLVSFNNNFSRCYQLDLVIGKISVRKWEKEKKSGGSGNLVD